jgi:hypothetical protein
MTYSKKFHDRDNCNSYNSKRYNVCPSYAKMGGHDKKIVIFMLFVYVLTQPIKRQL